jgi:diaminopimelate epimerase
MSGLAFHKYEGLGNDFVLVEADREDAVSPELASLLCDRRLGVGGDSVLLLLPPSSTAAQGRMKVINADGSVPEMCGNGLRCAVLHHARSRALASGEITFETGAGLRTSLLDTSGGRAFVTVDMGVIRIGEDLRLDLESDPNDVWDLTLADAGNPHAITTRGTTREVIDRVGPRIATHPRFPAGTNVEFAAFGPAAARAVDLVVWERGVGVTQACGTGACATVAVGVAKAKLPKNEEITVSLPGGSLFITIRDDGRAIMRGPARHVFSGNADAYEVAR